MQIDFYYFGYSCPINLETIQLLNSLDSSKFEVSTINIDDNLEIARSLNIYSPFLTIFDKKLRWHGPLTSKIINDIYNNKISEDKPFILNQSKIKFKGEIIQLNTSNIYLIKDGCTMTDCKNSCIKKAKFMINKSDTKVLGFLNLKDGQVVGGAEYLPSLAVPYAIPQNKDTALITCLYHSSDKFDYKYYPLKALENHLASKYKKIIAITDELGTYPNGTLRQFLSYGYKDEGILYQDGNYATLHLVSKIL
ncbi:MAG: hypothetical protein PUE01_11430 [Clostridiaceae bacterium]|nr:hypothetical protein [Clostridiaceae bacterium]